MATAPKPKPPEVHPPTKEDIGNLYDAVHKWEQFLSAEVKAAGGWEAKKESMLSVIRWLRTQV